MAERSRDEAVIEQPEAKKPKIEEKEGGSDFTDELQKENMSDSYSEGGGVYGEVMKEEDECEIDEDEDEDEDDESEDEERHFNRRFTLEHIQDIMSMYTCKPIEWNDEEIPSLALETPLYKNCVEGFDITHSDRNSLGLLYPFEILFENSEIEEWMTSISKKAINKYNQDQQTHWKYKEVIKANYNLFHGTLIFITFNAIDEDQDTKTFEAKVHTDSLGHFNHEDRVEFVRMKS